MKIGVDISSLQGPHRMRGIGYVASNFIKNIPAKSSDIFVFFINDQSSIPEKEILNTITLNQKKYEIRYIKSHILRNWGSIQLPFVLKRYALGLAKVTRKIFSMLRLNTSFKNESRKYCNTNDLDAFIQFDQSQPLAMLHKKNAKNYFIAYDLIPFVLENDYLWSYRIARSNNKNIVESVLAATNRNMYIRKIKINSKKAHKLLAISETTKHDFEKYANVPPEKIEVINLGVNIANKNHKASNNDGMVDRYYSTSWGYITKKESLKNQHFLLFVGGVDHRRKLDDVITAFNHLRAQGEDIKLVLSGDIMLGAEAITTESAREALSKSSYLDDVFFLGFTDDKTRDWLYSAALAFVFPSIYEGFGLPVLEAMQYHTPVIAYDNKAIREVAGDYPIYANDPLSMVESVRYLSNLDKKELSKLTDKAYHHSSRYTWKRTAESILEIISAQYNNTQQS